MKVFLITALFLTTSTAFSKINIQPGLWSVSSEIEFNGRKTNPAQEMQKAFANLPPEKRKQMMAMVNKMSSQKGGPSFLSMSNNGHKICYTEKMLKNEANLGKQKDKNCKTKKLKRTKNKIEMSFQCADGSKTSGVWTIINKKAYKGIMDVKAKDGKRGKIYFNGKFVSKNCGKVRPNL